MRFLLQNNRSDFRNKYQSGLSSQIWVPLNAGRYIGADNQSSIFKNRSDTDSVKLTDWITNQIALGNIDVSPTSVYNDNEVLFGDSVTGIAQNSEFTYTGTALNIGNSSYTDQSNSITLFRTQNNNQLQGSLHPGRAYLNCWGNDFGAAGDANNYPLIEFARYRGTNASPVILNVGDVIGQIRTYGGPGATGNAGIVTFLHRALHSADLLFSTGTGLAASINDPYNNGNRRLYIRGDNGSIEIAGYPNSRDDSATLDTPSGLLYTSATGDLLHIPLSDIPQGADGTAAGVDIGDLYVNSTTEALSVRLT